MKKILITGANGLLGQSVLRAFDKRFELLATARNATLNVAIKHLRYHPLDIVHWGKCREIVNEFKPDVIVNAAAFTNVDGCESQKEQCWRANVKGVENLARAARKNMALLVHISTDYVFDGQKGPYSEKQRPNPIGYYGKAKLASENVVRMTGIPYAIVRTNVVYGAGVNVKNNFFLWVYQNLNAGKSINIVTDQYNNPTFANDLAMGIRLLIEQSKYGIFNIAGPEYLNRYEFALKIAAVFGFPATNINPITYDVLQQKAPRPMRGGLRIDKAKKEFGYTPRSIVEALTSLKIRLEKETPGTV